jgi:hypothetical protein
VRKYIGTAAAAPAAATKPAANENPVFNAIKGLLDD